MEGDFMERDLTQGKIGKSILLFSIPMIFQYQQGRANQRGTKASLSISSHAPRTQSDLDSQPPLGDQLPNRYPVRRK